MRKFTLQTPRPKISFAGGIPSLRAERATQFATPKACSRLAAVKPTDLDAALFLKSTHALPHWVKTSMCSDHVDPHWLGLKVKLVPRLLRHSSDVACPGATHEVFERTLTGAERVSAAEQWSQWIAMSILDKRRSMSEGSPLEKSVMHGIFSIKGTKSATLRIREIRLHG